MSYFLAPLTFLNVNLTFFELSFFETFLVTFVLLREAFFVVGLTVGLTVGLAVVGLAVVGLTVVTLGVVVSSEVDVSGVDASGVDASGVDTSGVDASGVDASGVDTSGVDTSGVDTSGVDTSADDASGDVTSADDTSGCVTSADDASGVVTLGFVVALGVVVDVVVSEDSTCFVLPTTLISVTDTLMLSPAAIESFSLIPLSPSFSVVNCPNAIIKFCFEVAAVHSNSAE